MKMLFLAATAIAAFTAPAHAATIVFNDDFNSYPGNSVPWDGSGVWTTGNSVDLVTSGSFGLTCAGGTGNCVDLTGSGSTGAISKLLSLAAGTYELSFKYTGNQLGSQFPLAGFTVAAGSLVQAFTSLPNDSSVFTTFTGSFTTAGATTLSFTQNGGDPFRGSIIDDVTVTAVPEPATWAMLIMGFGLAGFALRRQPKVQVRFA